MDISKYIKELSMAAGISDTFHGRDCCSALDRIEQHILTLATESEQLRKRLAELETLLAQANKTIQWYERTEANND